MRTNDDKTKSLSNSLFAPNEIIGVITVTDFTYIVFEGYEIIIQSVDASNDNPLPKTR